VAKIYSYSEILGCIAGLATFLLSQPAFSAPYPNSDLIESITFDFSTVEQHGSGADQWPMTWADDGEIYSAWGDGRGWSESGSKKYEGVTQIVGSPPGLNGTDIWGSGGTNWKPDGIVADENKTLYLFHGLAKNPDNWSYGAKSTDNGRTWDFSFPGVFDRNSDGVFVVGICQFGPGYTNIPSGIDKNYFYVYLSNRWAPEDGLGKEVYLGKVLKADIFKRSAYTYFNGFDGSGNPLWTTSWSNKKPAFHDPAGMAYHVGVSYNPGLKRFLFAKTQKVGGSKASGVGIFEGPTPWGPWKTVYYENFRDNYTKFTVQFPQKWMSQDGKTIWMAWSGWPEYDNVNFIKATLNVKAVPLKYGASKSLSVKSLNFSIAPNPFKGITGIQLPGSIASAESNIPIHLAVYNLQGRMEANLTSSSLSSNHLKSSQTVIWKAGQLSAGTYIVRMQLGNREWSRTVKLIK